MAAPASTLGIFAGTVSDTGIASRALTEDEIANWGVEPPPTSTRDRGWYRAAHQARLAVKAAETAAWHVPIALATGALNPRVDTPRYGSRFAIRLTGVSVGRPVSCNALAFTYDREGGATRASDGGYYQFPGFAGGMAPNIAKPNVPRDVAYDLMNMSLHQGILKTRRGMKILAGAGSGVTGTPAAFYDCTNASGQTYHLYFGGGTIYTYDNGNLDAADTDWPVNELPTVATVGNKTFFLSSTRKRVFIDGTFSEVGVDAPTTGPTFVSATPSPGAPIATAPGYEYVFTYWDGTKLTDSGPSPVTTVVLPAGSPASTIRLGITISGDSAITSRRIWRRKVGDPNNVFLLVGEVADNTTLVFDDDDEDPGIEILEDFGGLAVTADFPEVTACAPWGDRLIAWGGDDNRHLYVSEPGDGERWWPGSIITCGGAIRGVIGGSEGRMLVFTDKTVESIEGDFLRSPLGDIGITRHVLDPSKGSFGPFAQCVGGGRVWWADPSGVHTFLTGSVSRDVTDTVSWPVDPIVKNAVDTLGTNVVLGYDYVSGQLWACLSQANAADATKNRVVLVLDFQRKKWTVLDHALSHVAMVKDGTYGSMFVGCDYNGGVLELDVYDADGIQGNESWLTGIAATGLFSAVDVAAKTVTFSGITFPTDGNGLRGVPVVFEDVSTGEFTKQIILSNTATVLTMDGVPASMVVGDKGWIGGIFWFFETAEVDAGTLDMKVLREVVVGLTDAANGAF